MQIEGLGSVPNQNRIFASVFGDGTIRIQGKEGEIGAVKRDYKTPDGKEGTKWEFIYSNIEGLITGISFNDSDFGQFIDVDFLLKGGKTITLGMSVDNSFSQDLMKKLGNVDFTKTVKVAPYSMEKENGKSLKGITIYQNGNKLQSFFYDPEKKININGFPATDKDKQYDKDDWKVYFIEVKKFLINYVKENIIPKIPHTISVTETNIPEIQEENIPTIEVDEIQFNEPEKKAEELPQTAPATDEDKDKIIKDLIYAKYGISGLNEVKVKAMELSSLAYISSNKDKIIEFLKGLK